MQNSDAQMPQPPAPVSNSPGITNTSLSDGVSISPMGGEMSQDQMKSSLQDLASKIEEAYQQFNTQQFVSKNTADVKKRDSIKEVFDMLSQAGVDLSNPESVKSFLDSLKEKNPELYQIVEASLEALFSDDSNPTPDESAGSPISAPTQIPTDVGQNNMNINPNENIPQNI